MGSNKLLINRRTLTMRIDYGNRHKLPEVPAIYRLQERRGFAWHDLYIGISRNVHERWNREGDRQHRHLARWRNGKSKMRLIVTPCWECNMRYWEALMIQRFKRISELLLLKRDCLLQDKAGDWFLRYYPYYKADALDKEIAEAEALAIARNMAISEEKQPNNFWEDLEDLGITRNSTLEGLISETPDCIVSTSIAALKEAQRTSSIRNPGGFLNKSIREAWQPNKNETQVTELEDFNRWWKWAYQRGMVVAATQLNGVQHVMLAGRSDTWTPLDEAMQICGIPNPFA